MCVGGVGGLGLRACKAGEHFQLCVPTAHHVVDVLIGEVCSADRSTQQWPALSGDLDSILAEQFLC